MQYIQGYISGCMQGACGSVRSVQGAGCRGRLWRRVRDGCLSAVSGRKLWRRVRDGCLNPVSGRELWRRVRDGCLSAVSGRKLWRRVRDGCLNPVSGRELWRRVRDGCLSAVSGRKLWRRVRKIPAVPFQDYRTIWTTFIGLSERLAAGVSARAADCAGRLPGAAGLCARGNSWQRGNKWIRLFFIPISNILLRG